VPATITTIDAESPNEPVIVMTRLFDARRELVWKVITDPKHVAEWYGGHGFTNPVCEMDIRPGGRWHHVMQAPTGAQFTIDAVFTEVREPERLAWRTIPDKKRNPPPPTMEQSITLEQRGNQTKFILVARFDSMAERDLTVQMGFATIVSQGIERIEAHLKTV
jgi:uncharacterized protein YndB with AHSA1/START domain